MLGPVGVSHLFPFVSRPSRLCPSSLLYHAFSYSFLVCARPCPRPFRAPLVFGQHPFFSHYGFSRSSSLPCEGSSPCGMPGRTRREGLGRDLGPRRSGPGLKRRRTSVHYPDLLRFGSQAIGMTPPLSRPGRPRAPLTRRTLVRHLHLPWPHPQPQPLLRQPCIEGLNRLAL